MSEANFILAVAQCRSLVGEVALNLEILERLCARAAGDGADLILFPEGVISGYSYEAMAALVAKVAEPVGGPITAALSAMARRHRLTICAGMFERDGEKIFNSHLVAYPDGCLDLQRKGVSACREPGLVSVEPRRKRFEWKGVAFGILVCADGALEDYPQQYERLGIDVLLHPSAGYTPETGPAQDARLKEEAAGIWANAREIARTLGVTYAVSNLVGYNGEHFYPGNSWIVHPDGEEMTVIAPTAIEDQMREEILYSALPRVRNATGSR